MEQPIGEAFQNFLGRVVLYAKALAKWLAVAVVIGVVCGFLSITLI